MLISTVMAKGTCDLSIAIIGKAPFGLAKELSDHLGSELELAYNHPTPPAQPGRIYASVEHILLALSPMALYAGKKAIDICADEVRKWLLKRPEDIEVKLFGPNGEVVSLIKKKPKFRAKMNPKNLKE
jgi:hypothetical protein